VEVDVRDEPLKPTTRAARELYRGVLQADYAGLTDAQLLGAFVESRDEVAFECLVRRHGPMVRGVCRRLLGHVQDAEDAFQAAFLVLAHKAAAVNPRDNLAGWLYGVARNTALKARELARKRLRRERPMAEETDAVAVPTEQLTADLVLALDAELNRLPDAQRTVLLLCDVDGLTQAEAGRRLGVPEGTVSSRLARARQSLAARLTKRGIAPTALGVLATSGGASAQLPPVLVSMVVDSAVCAGAGRSDQVAIRPTVLSLKQGVLRTMFARRLKSIGLVLFCALGLCAGAAALRAVSARNERPSNAAHQHVQAAAPAPVPTPMKWATKHIFTYASAVTAVAFGPDRVAATDELGALVVWNTNTGQVIKTISSGFNRGNPAFETTFRNIWFSLDGESLFMAHEGITNTVSQCWLESDRHIHVGIQGVNGSIPRDWDMPFYALTMDREFWLRIERGKTLILSRNDFGTDTEPGGRMSLGVEGEGFAHKDTITHVAADTRAAIVTVAGVVENPSPSAVEKNEKTPPLNPTLRLWTQRRDEPLWETELGCMGVTGVFVAPGGKRVVVTGDVGEVWVFDARSGKSVAKTSEGGSAIRAAAFGPGGKQFVVGYDDTTARVFDTDTWTEQAVLRGHTEAVTAIAFSPNGEQIVTGSRDKTVRVWEYRR
jgi:RNA polymerase sigma factor (sigma-70 family)